MAEKKRGDKNDINLLLNLLSFSYAVKKQTKAATLTKSRRKCTGCEQDMSKFKSHKKRVNTV